MRSIPLYQIDAFTQTVFHGNPAAVCPLDAWLDDAQLQAIASENNLAETAFFVPKGDHYHLRWFTPTQEMPLCGHATLASAFVIMAKLAPQRERVTFDSLSGPLHVTRAGELLTLDFPRRDPLACEPPAALLEGLGLAPEAVFTTGSDTNYYAVYAHEDDLRSLRPNWPLLEMLHPYAVAVTAPGRESDCAVRYFAPSYGIPEDPVTGSIHCALAPYWAARLGRPRVHSRQVSPRQGDLFCEVLAGRVLISGYAVQYLEGTIVI